MMRRAKEQDSKHVVFGVARERRRSRVMPEDTTALVGYRETWATSYPVEYQLLLQVQLVLTFLALTLLKPTNINLGRLSRCDVGFYPAKHNRTQTSTTVPLNYTRLNKMDRAFFALFIAILACCCLVGGSAIDRPTSTPSHHVNTTDSAVFRKPPIKPAHLENADVNFNGLDGENSDADVPPIYARLFRLLTGNANKAMKGDQNQTKKCEEDEDRSRAKAKE